MQVEIKQNPCSTTTKTYVISKETYLPPLHTVYSINLTKYYLTLVHFNLEMRTLEYSDRTYSSPKTLILLTLWWRCYDFYGELPDAELPKVYQIDKAH